MKKYLLTGFALLTFQTIAFSQENLIPNGDFENVAAIPERVGQFFLARPWASSAPGQEPADLFHKRSRSVSVRIPFNYVGEQEPFSGEAYAGIAVLRGGEIDYREFMQVLLEKPLEKGALYEIEFYTSLSDYSEIATSSLGFYFSHKPPLLIENGFLMARPQFQVPEDQIITEKNAWVKIAGQFKATGGETILTIGNFKARDAAPKLKVEPVGNFPVRQKSWKEKLLAIGKESDETYAYYYIDDIKLTRAAEKQPAVVARLPEPKPAPAPKPVPKASEYFGDLTARKTIRLNNIFFQADKAVLLPASYPELDKLHSFLVENPTVSIQINGHTDITHLPDYNQTLSENRAQAVKFYLIRKGIHNNRLKTKGFGETQPVATNDTEEGKQKNRRVEFEILP